MSRLTQAILGNKTAFANYSNSPMLDPTFGGQQGWAPNLSEWVSNQAYVRRNLVCILLEAPEFFKKMPNGDKYIQTLKSLFELHALTIEGLNAELTVDVEEHAVGGGGEKQHEFTNVTRATSEPSFTFVEKYGRPIQTFFETWIRYGIMDPDTKYALVNTISGANVTDMLADMYSASALFFEPDPTHTKVVKAWIVTNMFPKSTGEISSKRDLNSASEVLNLSISFTGLSQSNMGARVMAQKILNNINKTNADPYMRKAFIDKSSADVDSAQVGYTSELKEVATERVTI